MKLIEDPARTPAHCAACFAQKPDMVHVDFEASFDGPAFKDGHIDHGQSGRVDVTVDHMIVCLECVELAAGEVGLVRNDELKGQLERALEEAANLRERLAGYGDYAEKLEGALAGKNELLASPVEASV